MPPSRVGPTGYRRERLDKMRKPTPGKDSREPSPDVGGPAARAEHFAYYNLDYNSPYPSRRPTSANRQKVAFKDPFKEDRERRHKNETSLPIRHNPATSHPTPEGFHKSLPFRVSETRRISSAIDPHRFDAEVQMSLINRPESSTQDGPEPISPTQPDRIGPRAGRNARLQNLTSDLGELNLETSGSTANPESEKPRRGAIAFHGVPSVQQLSAALASDLELQPGLEAIADSLFYNDILPEVYIPAEISPEDGQKVCRDRLHSVIGKVRELEIENEEMNEELGKSILS